MSYLIAIEGQDIKVGTSSVAHIPYQNFRCYCPSMVTKCNTTQQNNFGLYYYEQLMYSYRRYGRLSVHNRTVCVCVCVCQVRQLLAVSALLEAEARVMQGRHDDALAPLEKAHKHALIYEKKVTREGKRRQ